MSGQAELNALVKRACSGQEPDDGKKREVGDALRKHPESASDLWKVFEPRLTSDEPGERWLAIDLLHETLSSAMPKLPGSDLEKFKSAAKKMRDGDREGGQETAGRLLDDKKLWEKLEGGGGGGGKHGGDDDDKHGMGGGGKHGGGILGGGKHGDDDDEKHGKGGKGGKHGGDDDDDKHGGGKHGGGGGKHGDDDDGKHGGGGGKGGKKHGHD